MCTLSVPNVLDHTQCCSTTCKVSSFEMGLVIGCIIWPTWFLNQHRGSSLLPMLHMWLKLSGSQPKWTHVFWVHWTFSCMIHTLALFLEVCVLLWDAVAAGHCDGAEWRALPLQVSECDICQEEAAAHIEFSQVLSATCQILHCHICHLRHNRGSKEYVAKDDS